MKPAGRVRLLQALRDEGDGDLVGDELPRCEDRLDAAAELGPVGDRRAEHVAGRDVRNVPLGRDSLGLGALAGALRPQHQQVHRKNPS